MVWSHTLIARLVCNTFFCLALAGTFILKLFIHFFLFHKLNSLYTVYLHIHNDIYNMHIYNLRKVRILNQKLKEKECEFKEKSEAQMQNEISLECKLINKKKLC